MKEKQLMEIIKLNSGYSTQELYIIIREDLDVDIRYDTLYRKLKKMAEKEVITAYRADNTIYWTPFESVKLMKDWSYYLDLFVKFDHPILNTIGERFGGKMQGKGNDFSRLYRKFIEAVQECEKGE